MQHARALLIHSDLPIALVGERIGYNDASALAAGLIYILDSHLRRFQSSNLYFLNTK
ncbi:hypothetical protein ACOBV8_18875 (plasmid) [Pseudoalteromonas espejiana]